MAPSIVYSWTGPASVGPQAPQPGDDLFGADIFFFGDYAIAPNRDYVLVEGEAALRQSLRHRLITDPGEYAARPTYGCGLKALVKEEITDRALREAAQRIADNLAEETRVDQVLAIDLEWTAATGVLVCTVLARARGRLVRDNVTVRLV